MNQIFKEATTWHGKMKDMAKSLVLEPKAYGSALQPEILEHGYNQEYKAQLISENVTKLLRDGVYLKRHEKDLQVFQKPVTMSTRLMFFIL